MLFVSQFFPLILAIIFLGLQIENKSCYPNFVRYILLAETGFLLPSIFLIVYWKKILKRNFNNSVNHHKYIILCYLRGISISLLHTLLVILGIELTGFITLSFQLGLFFFSIISPFFTTYSTIKLLNGSKKRKIF